MLECRTRYCGLPSTSLRMQLDCCLQYGTLKLHIWATTRIFPVPLLREGIWEAQQPWCGCACVVQVNTHHSQATISCHRTPESVHTVAVPSDRILSADLYPMMYGRDAHLCWGCLVAFTSFKYGTSYTRRNYQPSLQLCRVCFTRL